MKRIFTLTQGAMLLTAGLLAGCSMPAKHKAQTDMAARIYTQLATHYWQQGYTDIALNRLALALQHTPDYLPARELLQKIEQSQVTPQP